jgi:PST family polysaccharide transporter
LQQTTGEKNKMSDFQAAELGVPYSFQDNTLQGLKQKSLKGIGSLIKRQFVVKLIFVVANIILARLLAPEVFGIYAIVSFVVQFFATFGDVGIGAALIQKKSKLSTEELSTIFWLQQMLVCIVVGVVLVAALLVHRVYPSLPLGSVWLIRAMAISLIFTSLKTIPAILMERNLDFNRIALVDIAESFVFYVSVIAFALAGFKVWSFIIAVLIRSFLGMVMMYFFSSWRPKLQFRFGAVESLIRFGLPYQCNSILGFIKEAVTPLFVGAYAGAAAVGFVNFSKNLAFSPLMLSETFNRVAFPSFSKIQNNRELLAKTVERSIRSLTLVMFPIAALMVALGPGIIHVVFTDKWLPGLWAYYFYCTSPLLIGVLLPMYNAILAIGKSKIILKMMVALLILEWGLGVPFVLKFGFNGIAFSQPIIAIPFYFVYRQVLRAEQIRIEITKNIKRQLFAAVATGVLCKLTTVFIQLNLAILLVMFGTSMLFYISLTYLFNKNIFKEFREYLLKVIGKD